MLRCPLHLLKLFLKRAYIKIGANLLVNTFFDFAQLFRLESRINKIDFEPDRKEDQWKMGLMKSVYLCFMAINAGPSHEPIQWSCRIVKVWWAFISMVIVAMYTANLVAIFGAAEEFVHPVDSIGDFLKFGKTACVLEGSVVAQFLSYRYPTLATHEFAGFAEAFEALDDGTCAGIVDVPADTMSHQIPAGKCDNYEWVGEELSQLQLGVLGNPGNAVNTMNTGEKGRSQFRR